MPDLAPEPPPESPELTVRLSDMLDLTGALICVGLLLLTLAGRPSIPRLLLTLAFAGYVPGRAIVSNWPAFARWAGAAMSMVMSVAALALIATLTLWLHVWHPVGLFQAEAVLCLAGLALGTVRRHRRLAGAAQDSNGPTPAGTDSPDIRQRGHG
jgi:uncharacterized membrane protein